VPGTGNKKMKFPPYSFAFYSLIGNPIWIEIHFFFAAGVQQVWHMQPLFFKNTTRFLALSGPQLFTRKANYLVIF
jgi:hypothetical protein